MTEMRKHRHKWSYSRGMMPLPARGRCNANVCPKWCARRRLEKYGYLCDKHRCPSRIEPDWWEYDRAMWYAAVRIALLTWGVDDREDAFALNLWAMELLFGDEKRHSTRG